MLSILDDIIEVISFIPDYILYALETLINGFFSLIQVALEAANALLGGLPGVITPPGYLEEVNWYYPVGTLISVATPFVTLYIAWLGISYIYRKYGAL